MICPFLKTFNVECVYCDNGKCDDIQTNSGNGDSWCLEMLTKGNIISGLMPGTIEWLERQDNPVGVVQAALINKRVAIKLSDIKESAFEFKVDYKPFERDLEFGEYAEYGYESGQIQLINKLGLSLINDVEKNK